MTDRAAILESLAASLAEVEGNDDGDVFTSEGDVIAAVRDYIEGTQDSITGVALAEIAYAYLAGIEHATANTDETRPAYKALRKAGLNP